LHSVRRRRPVVPKAIAQPDGFPAQAKNERFSAFFVNMWDGCGWKREAIRRRRVKCVHIPGAFCDSGDFAVAFVQQSRTNRTLSPIFQKWVIEPWSGWQ
jgi:hypothetical protein